MQLNYLRARQTGEEMSEATRYTGFILLMLNSIMCIYLNFSDIKVKMEKFISLASVKRSDFNLKGCNEIMELKCQARAGVIKIMRKKIWWGLPSNQMATVNSGQLQLFFMVLMIMKTTTFFENWLVKSLKMNGGNLRRTGFLSHRKLTAWQKMFVRRKTNTVEDI